MAPLLVADAPYLLFRAYHALPESITGDDGAPVNAVLGAVNALAAAVAEHSPRAVIACFGQDAADYRVELFDGYHADRTGPMPGNLDRQFGLAWEMFEALAWTPEDRPGYEADDLLGSYAAAEEEAGGEALILTGDRDMFQCASDRVRVLWIPPGSRGGHLMGPDEVREKYGVGPEQVPDFIALRGDPSDGIPGARGIGEKTAASLLGRFGSLEGAIAAAAEQAPRVAGALTSQAEELRAFREIATLRRLDVEPPPDRPTDLARGAEAARRLGMARLAERLDET